MAFAPQSGSSFIPKSALERSNRPASSQPTSLLLVISIIIFLISGIVYGAAILYKSLIDNEINAPCAGTADTEQRCGLKATIEREKNNIDQNTIRDLQRLDKKISAVDSLVRQHKDLLRIFRLLEANTLPTIGYTSFDYAPEKMVMSGQAANFEAVAVQSEVWTDAKRKNEIKDFIFSDLDQGEDNKVKFKLTVEINPDLILATTPLQQ